MFGINKFYRHNRERDHFFQVMKYLLQDKGMYITVRHFNQGYTGKPWLMNGPNEYYIPLDKYREYVELSYHDLFKPRI